MQQVKLFTGLEGNTQELAEEINSWIRESGVKVLQVTGNIAPQSTASHPVESLPSGRPPSDLFIIVLYEA
jgi:hypothetical protein